MGYTLFCAPYMLVAVLAPILMLCIVGMYMGVVLAQIAGVNQFFQIMCGSVGVGLGLATGVGLMSLVEVKFPPKRKNSILISEK